MNHFRLSVIVAAATLLASACDYSASMSTGSSAMSSSSSSSAGESEVTLAGESGVAELGGDKVSLRDGTVFINDVSFGPVSAGAEVKYAMRPEGKVLFVGGERRNAPK